MGPERTNAPAGGVKKALLAPAPRPGTEGGPAAMAPDGAPSLDDLPGPARRVLVRQLGRWLAPLRQASSAWRGAVDAHVERLRIVAGDRPVQPLLALLRRVLSVRAVAIEVPLEPVDAGRSWRAEEDWVALEEEGGAHQGFYGPVLEALAYLDGLEVR
jgi:hypothetical protein